MDFSSLTGISRLSNGSANGSSECYDIIEAYKAMGYNACSAILEHPDQCESEGYIPYLSIYYCFMGESLVPLSAFLTFLWIGILFITAGLAADNYLCPSLTIIAKNLHLSENLAGVTFLAFGNGAPDIMSSIIAVHSASGDPGLAIGELLGGGIFVTTVVGAAVCILCPFSLMKRPFLRDVVFYIAGVIWIIVILHRGYIYFGEAVGFLVLYGVYVIVAVAGRIIRKMWLKTAAKCLQVDITSPDPSNPDLQTSYNPEDQMLDSATPEGAEEEDEPLIIRTTSPDPTWYMDFLYGLIPAEVFKFRGLSCWRKITTVVCFPFEIVLNLTVPVVVSRTEDPKERWCKILRVINCIALPMLIVAIIPGAARDLSGVFPSWALALLLALLLAAFVFFTSHVESPPWYHVVFAYMGFLGACVWIYLTANEIVASLQTLGIALDISTTILGLTVLAWGNSIPDFIADTSMARRGAPRVGISAVFAGPMLNLLLGVGISFCFATSSQNPFPVETTPLQYLSAGTLLLSLTFSLVFAVISRFKIGKVYGLILIVFYFVFLGLAIPTSLGKLF